MSADLDALRKLAEAAGELWELLLDPPPDEDPSGRDWHRLTMGAADARYIYAANPATILSLLDDLVRVTADLTTLRYLTTGRDDDLHRRNRKLTAERDELAATVERVREIAQCYIGRCGGLAELIRQRGPCNPAAELYQEILRALGGER